MSEGTGKESHNQLLKPCQLAWCYAAFHITFSFLSVIHSLAVSLSRWLPLTFSFWTCWSGDCDITLNEIPG